NGRCSQNNTFSVVRARAAKARMVAVVSSYTVIRLFSRRLRSVVRPGHARIESPRDRRHARMRSSRHSDEARACEEPMNAFISRGFSGRRRTPTELAARLPPGQYAESGW